VKINWSWWWRAAGGGLSSSSALVVAAALALLALWGLPASPAEVAELTCSCERYVGTQVSPESTL
jgi:N-acetylgalactosamine kinase